MRTILGAKLINHSTSISTETSPVVVESVLLMIDDCPKWYSIHPNCRTLDGNGCVIKSSDIRGVEHLDCAVHGDMDVIVAMIISKPTPTIKPRVKKNRYTNSFIVTSIDVMSIIVKFTESGCVRSYNIDGWDHAMYLPSGTTWVNECIEVGNEYRAITNPENTHILHLQKVN